MAVNADDVKRGAVIRSLGSGATLRISEVARNDVGGTSRDGSHPRRVALDSVLADWVLDEAAPDTECTRCGAMYASGTGHPRVAMCSNCHGFAPGDSASYCGLCRTSSGCRHT